MRQVAGTAHRIRTDLSATLFLAAPDEYDGGELVVEDTYGVHRVKLPAGHLVLYPVHQPAPRDAGDARRAHLRRSSGFRAWSATTAQRTLLFDLDSAIQRIGAGRAESSVGGAADRRLPQPAAAVGGDLMRRSGECCSGVISSPVVRRHRRLHHVGDRCAAHLSEADAVVGRSARCEHRAPAAVRDARFDSADAARARRDARGAGRPRRIALRADPAAPAAVTAARQRSTSIRTPAASSAKHAAGMRGVLREGRRRGTGTWRSGRVANDRQGRSPAPSN